MESAEANPEINLKDVPRLEEVSFLPVSRKYLRMRLALWGMVQLMSFGFVLAPFVARAFVENGEFDEFTQWWWPVSVLFIWGLLWFMEEWKGFESCLLYTSPSPRDATLSRMPSSA